VKIRALILIAIATLITAACKSKLPAGALEYSTFFDYSIPVGQNLPGTNIKYMGKTSQGAQMSIGGQTALKQTFDSLSWRGEITPGVKVDYNLRILAFDAKSLHVDGTTAFTISGAKPKAISSTALPKDAAKFTGVVSYNIPKGKNIPGTTITYEGKTSDGAKLSGIEGYPFRKEADSIVWNGQLADKLFLKLDLRVLLFSANYLAVTGPVTIHFKP